MDQPNQHGIAAANIDQPGQDKLNAICWEVLFDYLSFDEIYSMSQTCKRLQRIAGYYVKAYLPAVRGKIEFCERRLTARTSTAGVSPDVIIQEMVNRDGLNEYINELHIRCYRGAKFKLNYCLCTESFPSVKKLKLSDVKITESESRYIERILGQIETLKIDGCRIDGDLFVRLLQQCTKLKRLHVKGSWLGTHWLHHEYPTLENLEFESGNINQAGAKMVSFLTNNPNVKRFRIEAYFIWVNRQAFKEADIQLDCLVIDFDEVLIGPFVHLLGELHGRRFYKSLHINESSLMRIPQKYVDSVAPLSTLNALYIGYIKDIDLPSWKEMVHLKELRCRFFSVTMNLEALAKNLVNLEQLYINDARLKDILPFVRYSKKLYKVRINRLKGWTLSRDLTSLNNERHKLKDELHGRSPKIVILQLFNLVYMSFKWHTNNVSWDLIELKRTEMDLQIDSIPFIPDKERQ